MQKFQIKLMYEEAINRLNDAEILGTKINAKSNSQYLLELLAFEILLKAVVLANVTRRVMVIRNFIKTCR